VSGRRGGFEGAVMGRCRDDDAPVWAAVGAPVFCPYGVAVFTFLLHASVLKTFSATLMPLSGYNEQTNTHMRIRC